MTRHGLVPVALAVLALSGCSQSESTTSTPSASGVVAQETPTTTEMPENEGAVRYLALGDSLSQGVGATDEQTGSFPALLADSWRTDGCPVELLNAGVSGFTAGQILAEQVPRIAAFEPTLITFQAGGNDIASGVPIEEYRRNVQAVLDAATGSGARVIVLAQNEWFRSPAADDAGGDLAAQRSAYDDVMIAEARARGAEFVDLRPLYAQEADADRWVEDGIHPTPDVYEAWSAQLSNAVPAPCR
jgi:lysophospholipase L1-like esterase